MIDWTKPVRWVDDKAAAEVLKVNADGSAWVIERNGCRAFLYHRNGTWAGVAAIENIPEPVEPRVTWVLQYEDSSANAFCQEQSALRAAHDARIAFAFLKLTYTPGHASVEIIEERK